MDESKKFGSFFAVVSFVAAGYFATLTDGKFWALVFALLAAIFLILTLFAPALLSPLNKVWIGLGHLLGRIMNPIVLGLIFFVLITPVAVIGRMVGRDPLRLKMLTNSSYWINREPAGPAPDSFKNQF